MDIPTKEALPTPYLTFGGGIGFWESLARQSGLAPENFRMPQHHTNGPQRPEPSIVAEDSSSVSSLLRAAGDRKRPGQPSRSNRESPASSVVETSHRASGGDSSTSAACNISVASSSRTKPVALAQPAGNRSAVAPPEPTPQLPVGQSPEQAHPINSAIPHRGQSEETQNRRRARAARRASRLVLLPNAAMVPPALPISPPAMSAASLGIAVGVRQAPNPSHLNDTFNQRVEGPMGNNSVSEDSSHPPPGARLESRFTATLTHSSLTASRARQTTGVQSSQLRLPLSQYFVPATELSEGGIPDLNIEQGSTPFGRNPTNDNGPEEPLRHNVRTPEPQPTPIARNQTSDYAPETHRLPNGYNTYRARDEWTNYAQPGTQYSSTYYEYTPERSQHRHMNSHSSEIWESSVTAVRASQKRASELDLALVAEEASILLELFSKTRPLDDNEHKLMIGTALKSITEIHKELHGPPERDDSEYAAPPEGEDLKVDSGCIICYSQIADTVLMPCKHLVLCDVCSMLYHAY